MQETFQVEENVSGGCSECSRVTADSQVDVMARGTRSASSRSRSSPVLGSSPVHQIGNEKTRISSVLDFLTRCRQYVREMGLCNNKPIRCNIALRIV